VNNIDTGEQTRLARELALRVADRTISEKPLFLGQPTILSSLSTSTKKDRLNKKRQRQNRKKGRR